jgi:hypothetical protein
MTLAEFKRSLSNTRPPTELGAALTGLWWAGKGEWDKAHKIVMDEGGNDCAWVHAYLHRVEGDAENARYWYKQAGKPAASGPLPTEWASITTDLLSQLGGTP